MVGVSSENSSSLNILICFATYSGGMYCRKEFLSSVAAFLWYSKENLPLEVHMDLLAVTNSGEEDALDIKEQFSSLSSEPLTVLLADKQHHPLDQIVHNRNILRKHLLEHPEKKYDYMFSLDHDLLFPENCLVRLLAHKNLFVGGAYLTFRKDSSGKPHVLPCAYAPKNGSITESVQLSLFDVLIPRTIPVSVIGMGCTLIHRSVLEKIHFRRLPKTTEDTPMCLDYYELFGKRPLLDTRIKCTHIKYPIGDKRNAYLDFKNYNIKAKNAHKK